MTRTTRAATAADINDLVRLRRLMFTDMGVTDEPGWEGAAADWFADAVHSPRHHIVVTEEDGCVVACGMGELHCGAPAVTCPNGRTVLVSNLVTDRLMRGRGAASACMTELLRWAREDVAADRCELHASTDGIEWYRRLGFTETAPSMRLTLAGDAGSPPPWRDPLTHDCWVRRATRDDVPAVVAMLRDDPLGAGRETAGMSVYLEAFDAVDDDPRHLLALAVTADDEVVGTMHLTLLPGLARGGATRLQIEAVRVAAPRRGTGLGRLLFTWAHEWGRRRGATIAQLTTDKTRGRAQRFYAELGYEFSHEGLKCRLDDIE